MVASAEADLDGAFRNSQAKSRTHHRRLMRLRLLVTTYFLQLWGHDPGRAALRRVNQEVRRAPLTSLEPETCYRRQQRPPSPQPETPTELLMAAECPIELFIGEVRKHQVQRGPGWF